MSALHFSDFVILSRSVPRAAQPDRGAVEGSERHGVEQAVHGWVRGLSDAAGLGECVDAAQMLEIHRNLLPARVHE